MYKSVLLISIVIALFVLTRTVKESFSGFKKYGNSNFRGGDMSLSEVDKKKECAEMCSRSEPECKGFVVSNKKNKNGTWKCWLKNESAITGGNRKEDKDKTSYISKGHYDYWTKDDSTYFSKVRLTNASASASFINAHMGRSNEDPCETDVVTLWQETDTRGASKKFGCGTHTVSDIGVTSIEAPPTLKYKLFGMTPAVPAVFTPGGYRGERTSRRLAKAAVPAKEFSSDWMTGDQDNVGEGWNDKVTKIEVAKA